MPVPLTTTWATATTSLLNPTRVACFLGCGAVVTAVGVVVCEPEDPLVDELELGAPLDGALDFGLEDLCFECGELLGCPASGSTYC